MKTKQVGLLMAAVMAVSMIAGCGSKGDNNTDTTKTESKQDSDQEAADKVAKLIDDIYVQERTDKTDEQCEAAKAAWDKLRMAGARRQNVYLYAATGYGKTELLHRYLRRRRHIWLSGEGLTVETLQEIALPAEATMVIDDLARVLDPAVRREIVSMLDQPGLWLRGGDCQAVPFVGRSAAPEPAGKADHPAGRGQPVGGPAAGFGDEPGLQLYGGADE